MYSLIVVYVAVDAIQLLDKVSWTYPHNEMHVLYVALDKGISLILFLFHRDNVIKHTFSREHKTDTLHTEFIALANNLVHIVLLHVHCNSMYSIIKTYCD